MAKKTTAPKTATPAAPVAPVTPAPEVQAPTPAPAAKAKPTRKATPAPVAPVAPAYPVYPTVEKFTREDLSDMKAEYAALKSIEAPDEAQAARKVVLVALGKAVNQRIAVEGQLPSRVVAPTFDIVKVAEACNRVIPLDKPIDTKQDPAALEAEVKELLGELQVKDFQKGETENREIFSTEEAGWFQAMGIKLPAGVSVPKAGKVSSVKKGPKDPKAPKAPGAVVEKSPFGTRKGSSRYAMDVALHTGGKLEDVAKNATAIWNQHPLTPKNVANHANWLVENKRAVVTIKDDHYKADVVK